MMMMMMIISQWLKTDL